MEKRFNFKFISMLLALSIILSPVSLAVNNIANAMEIDAGVEENPEQLVDSETLSKVTKEAEANKVELQVTEETPFEFDEETGTITGYKGGKPPVDLVIPEEINGVPVKIIGYRAFYYTTLSGSKIQTQIKTLKLPDSIEVVGEWAFQGNLLGKLNIPDSITEVKERAFFRV